jgi:outer membrane protein assembly factor BamE (lipoprotein component of BamABCDE complex)
MVGWTDEGSGLILHVNNVRQRPGGAGLQLNRLRGTSNRNWAPGRPRARRMGFGSGTRPLAVAAVLTLGLLLGGCFTQNYQRGYVLAEGALEQIPLGAPQEQVLISLGTPSTVATVSGEVFYYISARTEQTSFLPEKVVDQRVVAVYFDKNRRVERLANYGLQDGKIFDYVSRTTPTSGQELSYLTYVFKIFGGK